MESLLRRATALDAKYLLKLMLGDMRIGVKQSLIEKAIAVAAGADVVAVRHAVMLEADLGRAAQMAFAGTLSEARMRLFHPLGFMLASPVETPEEAVERFSETRAKGRGSKAKKNGSRVQGLGDRADDVVAVDAAEEGSAEDIEMEAESLALGPQPLALTPAIHAFLEDKYDGMRAQVHCGDADAPGRVAIYSRNREDITESFPELEEAFARVTGPQPSAPGLSSGLILDGEILGWDLEAQKALPFSVLSQRIGRKRVGMTRGRRFRWCSWRSICSMPMASCCCRCRCARGARGWSVWLRSWAAW